ncbi:hypothetical protein L3Q82_007955 [Scortum barcoo]|uniref:Uncharacterized protein n=1 Tax=Scortum barcoo TaxID=214431 RepID=A0ACB8WKH0_9TELE|nr:hypothetical protein L3Q82_007955 [Scortum barcoo]
MQDNARPHVAGVCQQFLQDEGIDAMDWPARSPDLNPIEHIWDIMSRSIHQRHVAPQTVQELADALVQVWEEIPQETIRHLIRSMPRPALELLNLPQQMQIAQEHWVEKTFPVLLLLNQSFIVSLGGFPERAYICHKKEGFIRVSIAEAFSFMLSALGFKIIILNYGGNTWELCASHGENKRNLCYPKSKTIVQRSRGREETRDTSFYPSITYTVP